MTATPLRHIRKNDTTFNRYHYASEKLTGAIYKLATGKGPIKDRLSESFIELAILSEDDFPEELRAEYHDIMKTLTKNPSRQIPGFVDGIHTTVSSGRSGATIPFLRIEKAVTVAGRIVSLCYRLNDWLEINK